MTSSMCSEVAPRELCRHKKGPGGINILPDSCEFALSGGMRLGPL